MVTEVIEEEGTVVIVITEEVEVIAVITDMAAMEEKIINRLGKVSFNMRCRFISRLIYRGGSKELT